MRNTLQEQYNAIKEGRGNKEQFLKQARNLFPQYITKFLDFETSTNILKSKQVISEGVGGVVTKGFNITDWRKNLAEEVKAEEKKTSKEVEDANKNAFDNKDTKNIDNINFNEVLKGFYAELKDEKNQGKTAEELRDIAVKNLAKDPLYYTKNGMFGEKGVGFKDDAPGLGTPKEPKGKYKSSGYGDLDTEDKPAKVKSNVKDTLSGSEAKTTAPKKVKEMSVTSQNSKGVKKFDTPGKEKKIKLKESGGHASIYGLTSFHSNRKPTPKPTPQEDEVYLKDLNPGDIFKIGNLEYKVVKNDNDGGVDITYSDGTGWMTFRDDSIVTPIKNDIQLKEGLSLSELLKEDEIKEDIVVLKDDPSMDIKAGKYEVLYYGPEDEGEMAENIYLLKGEDGKEFELAADYVENKGYWGDGKGVGVGRFSNKEQKLNETSNLEILPPNQVTKGMEIWNENEPIGKVEDIQPAKNFEELRKYELESFDNIKNRIDKGEFDLENDYFVVVDISFEFQPSYVMDAVVGYYGLDDFFVPKDGVGERAPQDSTPQAEKGKMAFWSSIDESHSTFKVDDIVIPNVGPHKGQKHKIIFCREDGKYNIQPLSPKDVKYRLGAAAATADQLTKSIDEAYMGDEGDKVQISPTSNNEFILEKPDGSAMIDMRFSSKEEAKKYADKKGLEIVEKSIDESTKLRSIISQIVKEELK